MKNLHGASIDGLYFCQVWVKFWYVYRETKAWLKASIGKHELFYPVCVLYEHEHDHWNRNVVILMKIFITGCTESCHSDNFQ